MEAHIGDKKTGQKPKPPRREKERPIWERVVTLSAGGFLIEFDPNSKELTVSSQAPFEADAITAFGVDEIEACRTIVIRRPE